MGKPTNNTAPATIEEALVVLEASEKANAELTNKLEAAEASNLELQKQVDDLQKQVDSKKSKSDKELADSKKENAEVKSENDSLKDTIVDLKKQLASKTSEAKNANKQVTVNHGGKTFEVAIPRFNHNGTIYTAADLENHKDVIAELVKMKSDVLVEVE